MMYIEIPLKAMGPFNWRSLFSESEAEKFGVYLWTVQYKEKYLVHYVGETGVSFVKRFIDHTRNQLNGINCIYEPKKLAAGERDKLWEGWWKGREGFKKPTRVVEFLEKFTKLSKAAYDSIDKFQIFLLPFDPKFKTDERVRKRVETIIAEALFYRPGITRDFQDEYLFSDSNRQSYAKFERKSTEDPIKVIFENSDKIFGLQQELREDEIEDKNNRKVI